MATVTLVDGVVSSNTLVLPGHWVIVEPVAGASVLVEYSTATASDIVAGTDKWTSAITTTNPFVFKNDDDFCEIYVRITATGAAGTFEVVGEITRDKRYYVRGHEKYVINTAYKQVSETKKKFVLFEDFEGTWAIGDAGPADKWATTAGSGTGNEVATTVSSSVNGEVTLKSASDDGNHAANCSTFTSIAKSFKASQGGLAVEAKIKIDDISEAVLFVGFTDSLASTVELPIFLNGANIDSDATDACGIGYDVDGTTKQFFHGGVKNDTDTTPAYSGTAPVDATYFVVRVEVSSSGAVRGYVNGKPIGPEVENAITASTSVCPAIIIGNRSANQVIATIDYIKVEQNR